MKISNKSNIFSCKFDNNLCLMDLLLIILNYFIGYDGLGDFRIKKLYMTITTMIIIVIKLM